jgi:transposase
MLEQSDFGLNRIGGFPNHLCSDSNFWLGGGQQEMPKPYSQDLRNRVIDAAEAGGMSCRAAARRYEVSFSTAIKWLERYRREGLRGPVGHGGHRPSALMPHREFLEAARAEKSDVTLQELCDRIRSERGVNADTSMMSRFFRRIGVTLKKRPSSRANKTGRTSAGIGRAGEPISAASIPPASSSSTRPGPRPT